jgi:hypothetical protein
MKHFVESPADFPYIHVGGTVTLKINPRRLFTVTSVGGIYTVPNPVTLVTLDDKGQPHTLVVSAYCLTYGKDS